MGNNDFINMGGQASGGDINIQPQASGGTRFLSAFLGNMMQGGGQEAKMKKEKDKLSYYTELRQAGYSAEEASKRVNKQFSGGFLNKVLGKTDASFQAPSGASDQITDAQKKKADYDKTLQETALAKKKTDEWGQGKGGTGDTQKIKSLDGAISKIQIAIENAEAANKPQDGLRKQLAKYQKAYDKLLGADDSAPDPNQDDLGASPVNPILSQKYDLNKIYPHNGKNYKIDPNSKDPNNPDMIEVK
jgi:hypothetical protein